jgi:dipeptidyl aminopeptidase/acylaminoacyl peptidase
MYKVKLTLVLLFVISFSAFAQKPPLDHGVYDGWKSLASAAISDDGKWVTYELNPLQGDGWLYIFNSETGKKDSVFCGFRATFSPDCKYLVYQIKPTYAQTRKAKKDKLKDDMLPKNNMEIRLLEGNNEITNIKKVKSFSLPESNSQWMAYLLEKNSDDKKEARPSDSTRTPRPPARGRRAPEPKGTELVIINPVLHKEQRFADVTEYVVARDGKSISYLQVFPDTSKIDRFRVNIFDIQKETSSVIFEGKGSLKKLIENKAGDKLSFLFTQDTSKIKVYDLYLSKGLAEAGKIVDSSNPAMNSGWSVSENGTSYFSEDGTRLFFGTAEKPLKEPEDTLLPDEKYKLDVWSWDDAVLQPMQKKQIEQEQRRSYMAVYHLDKNLMVQLANKELPNVRPQQKGSIDIVLGSSDLKYLKESSWEGESASDYYIVNLKTGAKNLVLEKFDSRPSLSPSGKYLVYWDSNTRAWMSRNIATGIVKTISGDIKVPLYDELNDTPSEPNAYGIEGWMDDEKHILVKDRFDIWSLDLAGMEPSVNITNGFGRKNSVSFSYQKLDPEADYIGKKELMYLSSFNTENKEAGMYTLKAGSVANPSKITEGKWAFGRRLIKAKKAESLIWQKETFEISPELYLSDMNFGKERRISLTNPQQSKYNWGTVELVEWTSFDRQKLQGLLYKPENFDPAKKYPMIVYFYERNSEGLYSYFPPAPSASIINRTFAVSNGYLVFIPDIPYVTGYPGQSCYNAVISGTYALLDRYNFIDRNKLALDGQSWGGYQIAYLVTQTDLFVCAYAGAAVSNMISAYGGIRWETGMSRMFQYEHTQSRIGGSLWDKPLQYIENSPIFWVPKINTPLLLMNNDADGAVPWYQGIEFITALRRLNKPAWMLSYNDEAHNLVKRPNRKDISIRKMQFFDHYLKGAPMPYWMENGISQLEKGKKDGYELVKENGK